jgi:hypothetical protein
MFMDWQLNDHRCILTQIENKLRGRRNTLDVYEFHSLLLKKYDMNVSYETTKNIIIYGLSILWLIALFRYAW